MLKNLKNIIIGTVLGLSIITTITFLTSLYISNFVMHDKFKVGDCALQDYSNEFEKHISIYKVIKVGKVSYMVKEKYGYDLGWNYSTYVKGKSYFNTYELVPCSGAK